MKLILMRHGPAVEREVFQKTSFLDDSQRPLTEKGQRRVFDVCQKLLQSDYKVDLIVSSPFVRCQESAAESRKVFPAAPYVESIELTPASPPLAFLKWLKTQKTKAEIVLVFGHEPHLGLFASYLLSQKAEESFVEFKKASLLCLEIESLQELMPGTAVLKWLLPPKLIL